MNQIPKIEFKNRKTIAVSITPMGEVVVKAPIGCPMSFIDKFLIEKQAWIETKLKKTNTRNEKFAEIIEYKKLLFMGKSYFGYSSGAVKKITIIEDKILIPVSVSQDKVHNKITRWYHKMADQLLIARTKEISNMLKIVPTNIKCTGSRGRWGACNSNGELFLNWRCIMLPAHLIDYVIVHELAHLIELNHSPRFWAEVEKVLPNYKSLRKQIKEYGFCLKLF